MPKCDKCGKRTMNFRSHGDKVFCMNCYEAFTDDELMEIENKSEKSEIRRTLNEPKIDYSSLLGISKILAGLGWIGFVLLSIIGVLLILSMFVDGLLGGLIGLSLAIPLVSFLIISILLIAAGQLIRCFVSIEMHTKAIYHSVKKSS